MLLICRLSLLLPLPQPAAHTCFRQLDLPRYRSLEEVREKVVTAMTLGQGYMGIS